MATASRNARSSSSCLQMVGGACSDPLRSGRDSSLHDQCEPEGPVRRAQAVQHCDRKLLGHGHVDPAAVIEPERPPDSGPCRIIGAALRRRRKMPMRIREARKTISPRLRAHRAQTRHACQQSSQTWGQRCGWYGYMSPSSPAVAGPWDGPPVIRQWDGLDLRREGSHTPARTLRRS